MTMSLTPSGRGAVYGGAIGAGVGFLLALIYERSMGEAALAAAAGGVALGAAGAWVAGRGVDELLAAPAGATSSPATQVPPPPEGRPDPLAPSHRYALP